jgi:hypothetical protein
MAGMRVAWVCAALLAFPWGSAAQTQSVLRITVTLVDEAGAATPVGRHVLLISDNPATREPRRVLTGATGGVDIALPPGSYIVESDRPVALRGQAYQWTQLVDVVPGRDTTLALTAENARLVPLMAAAATADRPAPAPDPSLLLDQWQQSVVAVWSPTARGSGFLVDAHGLIATDRHVVGGATSVDVQVSPTLKVPARVLSAEVSRDVAVLWIDPGVVAARPVVPLPCLPAAAPSLEDGEEILALGAPLRTSTDLARGEVTVLHPRGIETDLRLLFGSAGGPVFNEAGAVVGLTSLAEADANRRSDVIVVRAITICDALSASRTKTSGTVPPEPTPRPVEPARPFVADAVSASNRSTATAADPPVASSDDFDVAFLTPPVLARAQQQADRTGGRSPRAAEVEARIGRLTEFGAWAEYFEDIPRVLIVRVTPKLVEGFWKRVAREAARTQGADLPAFKDFTTSFLRLRVSCGGADIVPIHPFVLEHRVSDDDVVREGLYVFDPEAFEAPCGAVTLSLYSTTSPEKPDAVTIDPKLIARIRQDFASSR